jgi:serine/threonine protein kinase
MIVRDLKSLNLLVDENYHIKVADFGLSQTKALTKVEQKSHSNSNVKGIEIKGTIRWQAPEVFTQGTYTEKSDIYSFGMVLYELLTEKTPYEDKSFLQILNVVDAQVSSKYVNSSLPKFSKAITDSSNRAE